MRKTLAHTKAMMAFCRLKEKMNMRRTHARSQMINMRTKQAEPHFNQSQTLFQFFLSYNKSLCFRVVVGLVARAIVRLNDCIV